MNIFFVIEQSHRSSPDRSKIRVHCRGLNLDPAELREVNDCTSSQNPIGLEFAGELVFCYSNWEPSEKWEHKDFIILLGCLHELLCPATPLVA